MNQLEVFKYGDHPVRTVAIDGEPWFVLSDLTKVLGLARGAAQVSERLDDGVRRTYPIRDSLGRTQQATIVSEPGMYEVVIRSDKPEAVAFRRWITSEVLPTIRKTGGYGRGEMTREQLLAQAVLESQTVIAERDSQIAELAPKADAWDSIVSSKGTWSFNEAAKYLHEHKCINIGERRLFDWAVEKKFLYRDHRGRPHVYQKYIEQGLFEVKATYYRDQVTGEMKTGSAPQVRITSKGLDRLHRVMTVGQLELVV